MSEQLQYYMVKNLVRPLFVLLLALMCMVSQLEAAQHPAYIAMQQAETLRLQGSHTLALDRLLQAKLQLESEDKLASARLHALLLNRLGDLYLQLAQWDKAADFLAESVVLARDVGDSRVLAANLNNFANMMVMAGHDDYAEAAFSESMELSHDDGDFSMYWQAASNYIRLAWRQRDHADAAKLLNDLLQQQHDDTIPPSAEPNISIARLLHRLRHDLEKEENSSKTLSQQQQWRQAEFAHLQRALKLATTAYQRSLASGLLGDWFDERGKPSAAIEHTQQGLLYAQQASHDELLYRWHWQLGRLLLKAGKRDAAISQLRQAVAILKPIQSAMLRGYRRLKSPFSSRIRPVYSTLADALLEQAETLPDGMQQQKLLQEARNILEQMKKAEMQDFFSSECIDISDQAQVQLDAIDPYTAIIYPIILPDRMSLLLSIHGKISQVVVPIRAKKLGSTALRFRQLLQTRSNNLFLHEAKQLHEWLIQPIEQYLSSAHINTLVFVPGGVLRTIPLAALHDGSSFLIERFALAVTLGLSLTMPKAMDKKNLNALVLGLSDAVQGFSPLPSVKKEMKGVASYFKSTTLGNQAFTVANMQQALDDDAFSIVHLATHGVFGGTPEESFMLTYDEKLDMNRLQALIGLSKHHRHPLELLTMSACQTAVGNERAALGLAGVAIKAGARSALASLWFVDDEATALMIRHFYAALLQPGVSKAEALQQAQQKLIDQKYFWHPSYWAPFLLIGNWL